MSTSSRGLPSKERSDSYSKYSNFIFCLINSNSIAKGTFFVTKRAGKQYLITAAHVIRGWNGIQAIQEENYPSEVFIRLQSNSEGFSLFKFNSSLFEVNSKRIPFFNEPDLFVAEINLPEGTKVDLLQYPIDSGYKKAHPVAGFLFGFPVTTNSSYEKITQELPSKSQGSIEEDIGKNIYYPEKNTYDSINYYLDAPGEGGFSGAPVFIQTQSGEIHFGGMCIGGATNKKWVYVVRPEFIEKAISKNKNYLSLIKAK